MVGIGNGRRLPDWMMGAPADDAQVQKLNDVNDKKKHLEKKLDSQVTQTKETNSTSHPRKSALVQGEEVLMEGSRVTDTECASRNRRGRKRKPGKADEVLDANVSNEVAPKSNRLGRKPLSLGSALDKSKTPDERGNSLDIEVQPEPSVDDDMDLTVEDLVAIAKEYVEGDEDRARKHRFKREREPSKLNIHTSFTMDRRRTEDQSFNSPHTDSKQCSVSCKASVSEDSSAISNGQKTDDVSVKRTGDPAKDMLDLFLGPLLKKSPENEKSKFADTDVQFSYDFKSDDQKRNGDVGDVVSVMKKKSSLKDKVALFLG